MNILIRIFSLAALCIILSCSGNRMPLELEQIKSVGDKDPILAIRMLDSLKNQIVIDDDYTINQVELLEIRLHDKANIVPISDLQIKKILPFFERNVTVRQRQEAYYYAGSVYRDLHDTPKSMEYFFQSLDCAQDAFENCDSTMLRNTYSNLNNLYYSVQDFANAKEMALKEIELSKALDLDAMTGYMHLASASLAKGDKQTALSAMDVVYRFILDSNIIDSYKDYLVYLLCSFAQLGCIEEADSCYNILHNSIEETPDAFYRIAFSKYFEAKGDTHAAINQCERLFNEESDCMNLYEGAKILFILYDLLGNTEEAQRYARIYMSLSDSIDFGGRQEMAATVNNMYRYNRDLRREIRLEEKSKKYRNELILLFIVTAFIMTISYLVYIIRSNTQLKRIMQLTSELNNVSEKEKGLKQQIQGKEQEVMQSQTMLFNSSAELAKTKEKLSQVMEQMEEYSNELKQREQQLSEKLEQNRAFIKLLHQAELETEAEDVIRSVRQTTKGLKPMTTYEWKQLYQSVDKLYPEFKGQLLNRLGKFTEQQLQVCYLIRIGLSNPQIQNITNQPRATVWRWVKKYEWILDL